MSVHNSLAESKEAYNFFFYLNYFDLVICSNHAICSILMCCNFLCLGLINRVVLNLVNVMKYDFILCTIYDEL